MTLRLHSLAAIAFAAALAGAASAEPIGYSSDRDTVVLRYSFTHGEMAAAEGSPSIIVYGDGRAQVHYPAYMKRSGDRQVQLSRAEITQVLDAIAAAGLLDLEPRALRAELRQAAREMESGMTRADGIQEIQAVEFVSDPPVTVIEVNVVRGQGAAAKPVRKLLRWLNLQRDARRFKNVGALQGFAEAENRLTAIMERTN